MELTRSLKHRNFRIYFFGQAVSLFGSWMQGTAVSWLTWKLTGSPKWLGAIGFASQVPILVVGLFAGVLADRTKRRRLNIAIQTVAMFQAGVLAFFTLTGAITPFLIFVLSVFMGFIFAFDYPARQSFLMDMVGKEDIGNAVALNSSIVHGGRVLGPVAAGFIVAEFGEGICFLVNALSFLFVLAALFMIDKRRLFPQELMDVSESLGSSIKEGFKVALKIEEIRKPLELMCVLSIAAMPYVFLMPQIVSDRFGGASRELGIAMSASGVGALIGAAYLAWRKGTDGLYRQIRRCFFASSIGLISMAFMPTLFIAVPSLILIGLGSFIVVAGTNTIMQTMVPAQYRGRVMSIFTVAFFGLAPIGSLISGLVASKVGSHVAVAIGGAVCLLALIKISLRTSR